MSGIVYGVGAPGAIAAVSGGYALAFNNITTAPVQVLGLVPGRKKIVFHNPGTVDIFVAQVSVQNTGSDVALVPSPSALGGCFRVYANGGSLTIDGECQKPWQAFAASGTGNPLTILPSNV